MRKMKRMFGALLAVTITFSALQSTSVTGNDLENVIVAPENMVFVQVVDETGNAIDGISTSLIDETGKKVASWKSESQEISEHNDSGITGGTGFYEPVETFHALLAPYEVKKVAVIQNSMSYLVNNSLHFNDEQSHRIKVEYIGDSKTALTVPANTFVTVVDSSWSSRYYTGYVLVDGTKCIFNNTAGKINSYNLTAGEYIPTLYLGGGCSMDTIHWL